jgi:hypothetical protein
MKTNIKLGVVRPRILLRDELGGVERCTLHLGFENIVYLPHVLGMEELLFEHVIRCADNVGR